MSQKPSAEAFLPLTPVVFHTLLALADAPSHGYAIARAVEDVTEGRVKMGPGTLYGSLHRMRDDGLIEEVEEPADDDGVHSERRRTYQLTALGRSALRLEGERLGRAAHLVESRLGA